MVQTASPSHPGQLRRICAAAPRCRRDIKRTCVNSCPPDAASPLLTTSAALPSLASLGGMQAM
ncbi:hypothetical protein EYF80_011910 [Liparis tanakae]|uniref:Uncharacterized protein n=1 Tax=Liparis tanakae TaxID=230148 RepID=A0A4Z2IKZ1_9TELE|nr:hypothetical protein EYF80_011910 [Liparis tanakae]